VNCCRRLKVAWPAVRRSAGRPELGARPLLGGQTVELSGVGGGQPGLLPPSVRLQGARPACWRFLRNKGGLEAGTELWAQLLAPAPCSEPVLKGAFAFDPAAVAADPLPLQNGALRA